MQTKSYIVFLSLAVAFFISCKKKESKLSAEIETLPSPEILPRKDSVNGGFDCQKFYELRKGVLVFSGFRSTAMFSNKLFKVNDYYFVDYRNIGNVFLNSIPLSKNNYGENRCIYVDSTSSYLTGTVHWKVVGKDDFPSFACDNSIPFPQFEGATSLIDSFYVGLDNPISIIGQNADSVSVTLSSEMGFLSKKQLNKNNQSVLLDTLNLYALTDRYQYPLHLSVELKNYGYAVFSNKYFYTSSTIQIHKIVYMSRVYAR